MYSEPARVAVKRDTGYCGFPFPLCVFIDGRPVGRVSARQIGEFSVPAGAHVVTVALASHQPCHHRLMIRSGDRVQLVCTSNQPGLHPLHLHAMAFLGLFFVLFWIGVFVPAIHQFVMDMVIELMVVVALGWVGMFIFFFRAFKQGTWHPALQLRLE